MIGAQNTYDERLLELECYFEALVSLYLDNDNIKNDEGDIENRGYHDDEFLKILKANALIMIYNLVEATVSEGILEIYGSVRSQGLDYENVNGEIKELWFNHKFEVVHDKSSGLYTYKKQAQKILSNVIDKQIIELDRNATKISGNLDAQSIRNICKTHGISFSVDTACRGGIVLEDVKKKRNELAHGSTSFAECGRDYTVDELKKIFFESKLFLKGLLIGMQDYYDNEKYRCS
jgi:hypothetical protein